MHECNPPAATRTRELRTGAAGTGVAAGGETTGAAVALGLSAERSVALSVDLSREFRSELAVLVSVDFDGVAFGRNGGDRIERLHLRVVGEIAQIFAGIDRRRLAQRGAGIADLAPHGAVLR